MRRLRWAAALAAPACLLACARPARAVASVVAFTATEYAFAGPDTVAPGIVLVRVINRGKELHQAALIRIGDGHTPDDVAGALAAVMAHKASRPGWISYAGGPDAIDPGDSGVAIQVLEPGRYAVVCVIATADGTLHVAKGMIHPLVVAGPAPARAAALPGGDVTIRLTDYDFALSGPLTAGPHTVRVENAGPQPHELQLAEAAPGKTAADFLAWAQGGEKGAPPAARWLGGVATLDAGRSANLALTLEPGTYLFICFWPDAKDGTPHFMRGMIKQVTVS